MKFIVLQLYYRHAMAILLFSYPDSYSVYFNNHNNDKDKSNILDLTKSFISKVSCNLEPTQLILYQRTIYARNLVEVTNARLCSIQSGKFMNFQNCYTRTCLTGS